MRTASRKVLAAIALLAFSPVFVRAQWRFDPGGYYYWADEPSRDFADFGFIVLAAGSSGKTNPAESALFDGSGKRFAFERLNTEWSPASGIHPFFEFSTVTVGGFRYAFAGRFLDNRVFAANVTDPQTVVAEGVLTKFVGGVRRAEARARFTYFARPWDKDAALMFAAKRGDLAAVTGFLAGGADPGAVGPYALTVLEYAVASGNEDVVTAILAAGADANAEPSKAGYDLHRTVQSDEGRTALMHAAARKDGRKIVSLLVRAGARVDARDWRGAAVLRYALFGTPEIVSALILAGADVNAADDEGRTVLMEAAARGDAAVVRILLRAGARTGPRSRSGETALSIARASGNDDIARILLKAEIRR